MNAIALDHVTLQIAGRIILENVSFSVEEGMFVGVLGPNGAGKTTLMRAILGLMPLKSGLLNVLGEKARRGNPAIGYMPQARRSIEGLRLSGWDFVASAVDGHRWGMATPNKQTQKEVSWALEMVGAPELAKRPLSQISGGERQRLLLAQALIGRPRLLLLDEPLISLDPRRQVSIVELVQKLSRELKIAVLFSAHEINPLLDSIDQVLYLGNKKAAIGAVSEIITGPVLSRLYDSDIDVVHLNGRIFVLSGKHDLEKAEHHH